MKHIHGRKNEKMPRIDVKLTQSGGQIASKQSMVDY